MTFRFLIFSSLALLASCAPSISTTTLTYPFFQPGQTWTFSFASSERGAAAKAISWDMPVGPRVSSGSGASIYAYKDKENPEFTNQNTFSYYPAGVAPAYVEVANTISLPDRVLTQFCIVRNPRLSDDDSLEGVLLFINFKSRAATHDDLPQELVYNYLRTGWSGNLQACSLKKVVRDEVVEA